METFFERLQRETQIERHALVQVPLIQQALQGNIRRETYIAYLKEAYHHVKHTVPLMMATGAHLPERNHWVRHALAEYIEEEIGHEDWILNDIRAAGGDADAAIAEGPSAATEMMVAYAYDTVTRRNPMGFFGMVFVLEGTSTALATQAAESIMQSLQLPRTACSYLLSHGSLDLKHMDFFRDLVNRISDPQDQADLIHMARRMFALFAEVFRSIPTQFLSQEAA